MLVDVNNILIILSYYMKGVKKKVNTTTKTHFGDIVQKSTSQLDPKELLKKSDSKYTLFFYLYYC